MFTVKKLRYTETLGTAVDNSCFNRDIGKMYGMKKSDNMRFAMVIMFLIVSVSPHCSPNLKDI